MSRISAFEVVYDADSDVLYISRRRDVAARGIEDKSGIVWRYDRSGELIGATVVDFHDLWASRGDELASELSEKFHVPTPQAQVVVNFALEQRD
ncbi:MULTISPECIES: DUF2283 domain-containing protein [Mesorhizobium]|uniref:DUF2283 domain-containing protein n=1 Tax=Mesorhizobium TaxID=68287 RepID=UPI0013DEEAD0|nr:MULTISPECIES: DUF2283 domain-containing protein [Mesorhizobium]MCF6122504.1 DUF2283 domain-containing protein [Mesorhizobium ciceri]MCQ8815659.1 DUF2283 domain-containing protein [Mesorhizobium sp. SEMIA396]